MTNTFNELALQAELLRGLDELGHQEPTPIQSAVIPLMLDGQDVIGQAQTGTGKTAAFALPMLQKLDPDQMKVQGLVLAPTRELAIQVTEAIREYARFKNVAVLSVYGGQPYGPQIKGLKRGADIVVGTPGRMLDLIKRKSLDLSQVHTLILDEADEMLSMGFIEDIETILKETPHDRQTALFSATMPKAIQNLSKKYMRDSKLVQIEHKQLTVEALEQRYYLVNVEDKLAAITRLFEMEDIGSALIFTRTRAGSAELANQLAVRGFLAEVLNGDLSQDARERVMKRFRSGQIHVLVATDVAARGLDIDDISHVFNFDLPDDPEIYVHRVGRTGRAGKTGIAITICTPPGVRRLRRIESFTHQKIKETKIPSKEEILQSREARLLEQVDVWLKRGRCQREREIVDELVESGHDPLEIAAVALKLARAEEKQRPIQKMGEVRRESRDHSRRPNRKGKERFQRSSSGSRRDRYEAKHSHESGMVRLVISKGKAHGVSPNEVVSTIAFHADIPGSKIGKISIHPKHTLVDVPEKFTEQVIANAGNFRLRKQTVTVKRG